MFIYIQTKQFCKAIAVIVFLSIALSSSGQWYLQHPYPTSSTLKAISFVDENEGWAAGDDGVVLHTLDGGLNWEIQHQNEVYDFHGIYFQNQTDGWGVGHKYVGVILKTTDCDTSYLGLHYSQFFNVVNKAS